MDIKKGTIKNLNYDVFLKGKILNLVAIDKEIVEETNWYKWFNNDEVTKLTYHHYYPNTKSKQRVFFEKNILHNENKLQLGIVDINSNTFFGVISLNNIDHINQKCEIAIMIGEKKFQKLKPLVEAHKLLINHAFQQLNMNKVYIGTMSKEVSIIFERILDFKNEGILRSDFYKNGNFHDVYLMSVLKSECNYLKI